MNKLKRFATGILCAGVVMSSSMFALPNVVRADGVAIDSKNFPDAAFREYLLKNFDDGDKVFSAAEITNVTWIYVYNKGISDLTGIENFTELNCLICWDNELTKLDVSKNVD